MSKRDIWQLISDDSVWMFPAEVALSTVELPRKWYPVDPYESCLFFSGGDSEVIARYATKADAVEGHAELEKKYGLKRCLKLGI